jgi:hypothetical protein
MSTAAPITEGFAHPNPEVRLVALAKAPPHPEAHVAFGLALLYGHLWTGPGPEGCDMTERLIFFLTRVHFPRNRWGVHFLRYLSEDSVHGHHAADLWQASAYVTVQDDGYDWSLNVGEWRRLVHRVGHWIGVQPDEVLFAGAFGQGSSQAFGMLPPVDFVHRWWRGVRANRPYRMAVVAEWLGNDGHGDEARRRCLAHVPPRWTWWVSWAWRVGASLTLHKWRPTPEKRATWGQHRRWPIPHLDGTAAVCCAGCAEPVRELTGPCHLCGHPVEEESVAIHVVKLVVRDRYCPRCVVDLGSEWAPRTCPCCGLDLESHPPQVDGLSQEAFDQA